MYRSAAERVSLASRPSRRLTAPIGFGAPQPATVCPNCGQAWTGSPACTFCGQVWGLPKGIMLSSAGRRFGEYLLEGFSSSARW
jgi:hypothetical protein